MSTDKGREGESRAARYLKWRGYTLLDRNVRLARGEIDLIARKGELLAFVEVKAHASRESALLAVDRQKCERMQSAAAAYLALHPECAALQCRFDLIILTPADGIFSRNAIEHIEDIIR